MSPQPTVAAIEPASVSQLLRALRHLTGTRRFRILSALLPELFRQGLLPSTAETCLFGELATFDADYARLAEILGSPGKKPVIDEIGFLRSIAAKTSPGTVAPGDYLFLSAFASIVGPERVIEIGTLTGFSAAVIAAALHFRAPANPAARVDTIDISQQCIIDRSRPTGFLLAQMIPEIASIVRVHTPHDSAYVTKLAEQNELPFAFIDANHQHPYPLLDLLRLAPRMRHGAWVLLHDTRWGTMGRNAAAAGEKLGWPAAYGAEWLFDSWPFPKISGGNIGAVQLPHSRRALFSFALRFSAVPFEVKSKIARRIEPELFRSLSELLFVSHEGRA